MGKQEELLNSKEVQKAKEESLAAQTQETSDAHTINAKIAQINDALIKAVARRAGLMDQIVVDGWFTNHTDQQLVSGVLDAFLNLKRAQHTVQAFAMEKFMMIHCWVKDIGVELRKPTATDYSKEDQVREVLTYFMKMSGDDESKVSLEALEFRASVSHVLTQI